MQRAIKLIVLSPDTNAASMVTDNFLDKNVFLESYSEGLINIFLSRKKLYARTKSCMVKPVNLLSLQQTVSPPSLDLLHEMVFLLYVHEQFQNMHLDCNLLG